MNVSLFTHRKNPRLWFLQFCHLTVSVPLCSYADLPVIASGHFYVESCSGKEVGDVCLMQCEDNYYPATDIETRCQISGSAKAAWSFPEDGFHCTG
ncbi:hypothetical protein HOLleu_40229 [Holothuria leucospilota]|uniref:Sushi domain-containing protein n=1 Tax=Holothuria leucospilota TaxID=206669 RepID=A0A9Q1BDG6_HOLLE|nr:hypothetical protein HOLleu_40229 [Holothuria leucospilota]